MSKTLGASLAPQALIFRRYPAGLVPAPVIVVDRHFR